MEKNKPKFNPKKFKNVSVVIDSSVLLKVFLGEEGREYVKELLRMSENNELTLIAPSLIVFEFLNTVARKSSFDDAILAYKMFSGFKISIIEPNGKYVCYAIGEVCTNPKISYYDASYHALAKDFDGVFLTADKKYYELMKKEGDVELFE